MKHTLFNMPTLRRTTLLAMLLLGTTAMWAGTASGTYVLVGDLWMYSNGTSWDNGSAPEMPVTDGVASVTYMAPKGINRFEIIKNWSWEQKLNGGSYGSIIESVPGQPALSVEGEHMQFTLEKPQQVTITYDGSKVRAYAEDYTPTFFDGWYITGDAWGQIGGQNMASWYGKDHSNQKLVNADGIGKVSVKNVPSGTHKFKICKSTGDGGQVAFDVFNAPYVDVDNKPSFLTWSMQGSKFGRQIPMDDNYYRNITFSVSQTVNIDIYFDGNKITITEEGAPAPVPTCPNCGTLGLEQQTN